MLGGDGTEEGRGAELDGPGLGGERGVGGELLMREDGFTLMSWVEVLLGV